MVEKSTFAATVHSTNIYGYCSMNSSRIPPKRVKTKKKKKKELNADVDAASVNPNAALVYFWRSEFDYDSTFDKAIL